MFDDLFQRLGIGAVNRGVSPLDERGPAAGPLLRPTNPATGSPLPAVRSATLEEYEAVVDRARESFPAWRMVPPPRRGEVVRQIGEALRVHKTDLGLLITLETGKIRTEGEGEVQEMIDMCDFAVGLSRQLYGLTIASERPAPPDDRAMAPARADRHHHGVQLPHGRLGLERHDRRRLRRHDGLEALAAHALDRRRRAAGRRSGRPLERLRGRVPALRRRRRDRPADARGPPPSPDLGDRQLPAGTRRRRGRGPPPRPIAPRAGGQQRDHHRPVRRRSSWRSRPRSSRRSARPASVALPRAG